MIKTIFFGTPAFAVPFLAACVDDPEIDVRAVVTQPDKPSGRGRDTKPTPVKRAALARDLPVHTPDTLSTEDAKTLLSQYEADVFIVVAYGKLIPQDILDVPPRGCINVHPSLLPKYRGPAPMQAAIKNGDEETGVTIMKLDAGMDTGPILDQMPVPIDAEETYPSLQKKIEDIGPPFLRKTLKKYIAGEITPEPQSENNTSVTSLLAKEDGRVDWQRSAVEIERTHRAYQPWPGTWTAWNQDGQAIRLNIKEMEVTDKTAQSRPGTLHIQNDRLFVDTGDGQIEIKRLQPAGKTPMNASEFIRGYPEIDGGVLV